MTSASFGALARATIDVPANGWLMATGSVQFWCNTATVESTAINFGLALDGTTPANIYTDVIENCAWPGYRAVSATHLFPVTAGRHAVSLVIARAGGTAHPTVTSRDIAVVYVNQNSIGAS